MIIRPAKQRTKCFYCEGIGTFAVSQKSTFYPTHVCQKHHDSILYPARIIYTSHAHRKDNKPISNVRFIMFFRQVAVMTEGGLKELGYAGRSRSHCTIVPDERSAVDFLLENPPINADGKLFRIAKGREGKKLYEACSNPRILKISNSLQSPSIRTISAEGAFQKLTKSKKQNIRWLGGNTIAIF